MINVSDLVGELAVDVQSVSLKVALVLNQDLNIWLVSVVQPILYHLKLIKRLNFAVKQRMK